MGWGPSECPGWVERTLGRSGMGRGTLREVRVGSETLGEVR